MTDPGLQPVPPALVDYRATPGAFEALRRDRYVAWLRAYLADGGKITDVYDYPYPGEIRFLLAIRDFTTDGETGSAARAILVPPGVRHLGGALGHCKLYFEADASSGPLAKSAVPETLWVPAFSNPEFEELPGYAEAALRAFKARAELEQYGRALRARAEVQAQRSDLTAHIRRPGVEGRGRMRAPGTLEGR